MVFTERTGLVNLSAMMKYCINETNCRRAIIAECFNDTWSPHDCTGRCDVCAKLSGADGGDCILNEGSEKYKVRSDIVQMLSNCCGHKCCLRIDIQTNVIVQNF